MVLHNFSLWNAGAVELEGAEITSGATGANMPESWATSTWVPIEGRKEESASSKTLLTSTSPGRLGRPDADCESSMPVACSLGIELSFNLQLFPP